MWIHDTIYSISPHRNSSWSRNWVRYPFFWSLKKVLFVIIITVTVIIMITIALIARTLYGQHRLIYSISPYTAFTLQVICILYCIRYAALNVDRNPLPNPDSNPAPALSQAIKLGVMGVSIVASSGDDGANSYEARGNKANCGYNPVWPASCPFITSVGSTQVRTVLLTMCVMCTYSCLTCIYLNMRTI